MKLKKSALYALGILTLSAILLLLPSCSLLHSTGGEVTLPQDETSIDIWDDTTASTDPSEGTEAVTEEPHIHQLGDWMMSKEPTCTENGQEVRRCACGYELPRDVPALGHYEVADEAAAPTCTEDGRTAGSHCSVCGETIIRPDVIPALGHTPQADEDKAATCTEAGFSGGAHCTVCGAVTSEAQVVPALGHTESVTEGTPATCTATGMSNGTVCTVCGAVLKAQEVIPAVGHTEAEMPAVAPTCTEVGLTAGVRCSVCDVVLTAQEEIPALGHTVAVDPAVEPTCTETGLTEGSHCTVCGETILAQQEIPALGHEYVDNECVRCHLAILPKADVFCCVVTPDGPVDESGKGYTLTGSKKIVEYNGNYGLSFNGSSSVNVNGFDKAYTSLQKHLTFEIVCRIGDSKSYQCICSSLQSGGFGIDSNSGKINMKVNVDGTFVTASTKMSAGLYHIVGVWDGTSVKLYVNGSLAAVTEKAGTMRLPENNGARYLCIGGDSGPGGKSEYLFNGEVYSVRVYSSVLTDQQIAQVYSDHKI